MRVMSFSPKEYKVQRTQENETARKLYDNFKILPTLEQHIRKKQIYGTAKIIDFIFHRTDWSCYHWSHIPHLIQHSLQKEIQE